MADVNDSLERSLDSIGSSGVRVAPPPPASFLRAVGRRRAQRRVRRASASVACAVVLGAGLFMATRGTAPPGPGARAERVTATPITTGWYHHHAGTVAPEYPSAREARPFRACRASDWRNEEVLAALIGSS